MDTPPHSMDTQDAATILLFEFCRRMREACNPMILACKRGEVIQHDHLLVI
jgi:hypothetical protein